MHPLLARRGRLLPYLAACAPLAAIVTALLARGGGLPLSAAAALAVPLTLAYAFIGLSAWYPCRQFPLGRSRIPQMVATLTAAALVTSSLWVLLGSGLARLLANLPRFSLAAAQYAAQAPALLAAGVLLYFLYAAMHYVLLSLEAARAAERREAEMQILAREAEVAVLKAQIQPHFLFNSLNSISSLAGTDPARAQEMCVRLSEFLRKSLAVGETPSIAMGDELALSRAYLSVEALRFGERLVFEEDLDGRGELCQVPPLLLQPLVENAVRHGIASCVAGGTVRLAVRFGAGRLRILLENPYDPESPVRAGGGLGLSNVRRRLAARYGSDAMFAAKRMNDRFLVVISVPAELPA